MLAWVYLSTTANYYSSYRIPLLIAIVTTDMGKSPASPVVAVRLPAKTSASPPTGKLCPRVLALLVAFYHFVYIFRVSTEASVVPHRLGPEAFGPLND